MPNLLSSVAASGIPIVGARRKMAKYQIEVDVAQAT